MIESSPLVVKYWHFVLLSWVGWQTKASVFDDLGMKLKYQHLNIFLQEVVSLLMNILIDG